MKDCGGCFSCECKREELQSLREKLGLVESTLVLIAAPKRADGTYNRSREACQELAAEVLAKIRGEK